MQHQPADNKKPAKKSLSIKNSAYCMWEKKEKRESVCSSCSTLKMIRWTYVHLHQTWTGFLTSRTRPVTSEPTDNRRLAAVSRPSMMDEKLAKQIEQHKKRWKEHPEECQAEINSMSDEEVYEGIRNCTFLDTEIPGESREEFVRRLKKRKKQKNK